MSLRGVCLGLLVMLVSGVVHAQYVIECYDFRPASRPNQDNEFFLDNGSFVLQVGGSSITLCADGRCSGQKIFYCNTIPAIKFVAKFPGQGTVEVPCSVSANGVAQSYYFSPKSYKNSTVGGYITVQAYKCSYMITGVAEKGGVYMCPQDLYFSLTKNCSSPYSIGYGEDLSLYIGTSTDNLKYLTTIPANSLGKSIKYDDIIDIVGTEHFVFQLREGKLVWKGNADDLYEQMYFRFRPNAHMPASLLVENDTLKGLDVYDGERYTLHSPISGHYCQSSKSDDMELFPGVYNLRFEGVTQNAVCPVDRTIYVPEISMNTINGNDTINFWYSDEERDNVVVVDMPFLDKDSCKVDLSQFELSVNNGDLDFSKLDDEIKIKRFNADGTSGGEASVQAYRYSITSTDKLNTIKILPKDNSAVIPATYNFKLNSYPKIGVADTLFSQATCHYDLAELEMKDISGGLNGDYVYQIGKASEMNPIPDNGKINIEKIGGGQTSGIVYVYDKDIPDGDTGHEKRKDSIILNFQWPDSILIKNIEIDSVKCFGGSTGKADISEALFPGKSKQNNFTWLLSDAETVISNNSKAENLPAGNYIAVIDNGVCFDTAAVTIEEPKKLRLETKHKPASCYGFSDGWISASANGGTLPYFYKWSNTDENTNYVLDLKSGAYDLTLSDKNGCDTSTTININQPAELLNNLLQSYEICKNSTLTIGTDDKFSEQYVDYLWRDNAKNEISDERFYTFSQDNKPGKYFLISTAPNGCEHVDTLLISFSDNELDVDFLMATQVFLNDTFVVVEKSDKQLSEFQWNYNVDCFEEQTSDHSYEHTLLATTPGIHNIELLAEYDGCKAQQIKQIEVLDMERPDDGMDWIFPELSVFKSLKVGPNPNDGKFNLNIQLTEPLDITASLYDANNSQLIEKRSFKGVDNLETYFSVDTHSGIFALIVQCGKEIKVTKIIVSR